MKIILADDHAIVRSGLKHLLSELAEQTDIIEASSFAEVDARLGQDGAGPPDLLVLDMRMPGYRGIEHLGQLVERMAPAPVVVFSMYEEPEQMRAALAEGVRAFIPKSIDEQQVLSIIRLALAGGTYMPPVLSGIVPRSQATPGMAGPEAAGYIQPDPEDEEMSQMAGGVALPPLGSADPKSLPAPLPSLTRRQRQVLELLCEGLSNLDISERLGLNLSTVKSHVTGILRALEVESRTQAVLAVQRLFEATPDRPGAGPREPRVEP